MIIVNIQGGLCNQLFQWACGFNLSKTQEVFFDPSFFANQFVNTTVTRREYLLDKILNVNIPLLNNQVYQRFKEKPIEIISDNFHYKDFNFKADKNYILNGYWQSEKYFGQSKNDIKNNFNWPEIKNFNFEHSCSIHARRGDYITTQHVHPLQTIDYYKKAIEILNPKGNIFIFSDDINWCKSNLSFENCIFMENNTNIQDLKYMSLCKDNIIANSSFSWWAAFLNQNKNKKIICPKNWFSDHTNDSDIKNPNWIQI
jgi:hypothetical protein